MTETNNELETLVLDTLACGCFGTPTGTLRGDAAQCDQNTADDRGHRVFWAEVLS